MSEDKVAAAPVPCRHPNECDQCISVEVALALSDELTLAKARIVGLVKEALMKETQR